MVIKKFAYDRSFLAQMFGSKKFIKFYWSLAFPGILYGLLTSFGPFIATTLFRVFSNNPQDDSNITILYLVNARYLGLQGSFFAVVTTIVRASVSSIVNRQGMGDERALHSQVRAMIFLGICASVLVIVIVHVFSDKIAIDLLAAYNQNIKETTPEQIAFYFQFYMMVMSYDVLWLFLSVTHNIFFYSTKYIRDLLYVYFWRFVYIVVAYPLFIKYSNHYHITDRLLGLALLSTFEKVLVIVYAGVFTYLPWIYRFRFLRTKLLTTTNHNVRDFQKDLHERYLIFKNRFICVYRERNRMFQYSFFRTGIKLRMEDFKLIFYLGWPALIDGYSLALINFFIGSWLGNIRYSSWADYNKITITTSTLRSTTYGFVSGTSSILPAALVTYELGRGNITQAKKNAWRIFWWGHLVSFAFAAVFLLSSWSIPQIIAKGQGERIIRLATIFTIIFGISEGFWLAYRVIFLLLSAGCNRYVMFANAGTSFLRIIILFFALNIRIQFGNLWAEGSDEQYIYYNLSFGSYTLVKYGVALLLFVFSKWTHNAQEMGQKRNLVKFVYDVMVNLLQQKKLKKTTA